MKKEETNAKTKKRKWIAISIGILAVILVIVLFFMNKHEIIERIPTLTIETPQKINPSETDEFMLDVTISTLGDTFYPAASMSISFDASYLEFLGVEEGNLLIRNEAGDTSQKLPDWSCNPEQSNKSGVINIMYLDITGGKNAFVQELLAEEDNVVIRLKFRLRGSVREGDVYDLIFDDAVFAASDEAESLAMTRDTLKVRNGKIVIGE